MPRNSFAGGATRSNVAKTCGQVSVGAASATIVQANNARSEITICNDHATQVAYLMLNTTDGTTVPTALANQGIRLSAAGGSWTSNAYTGPIAAIATGAATVLTVSEI